MFNRGIIISIQPTPRTAFDNADRIADFARMAEQAGAVAVKIEGIKNIEAVRKAVKIPVIGIIKLWKHTVGSRPLITPMLYDVSSIFIAGADYAGTEWLETIEQAQGHERAKIIFEADSLATSKVAQSFGVAAIATTLYGYTEETEERFSPDPDMEAIKGLSVLSCPIIAEGRFSQMKQIQEAVKFGAHSVCIGTAVTRPDIVIAQYVKGFASEEAVRNC